MLSMRDGIKLHTLIYLPRDNGNSSSKYTAIVDRSPYGYGDMEWITDIFLPFGFVAIGQDIRYVNFLNLCIFLFSGICFIL
jgi:predicted acyl esterase